jgi:arginine-tRNA-protein transferase
VVKKETMDFRKPQREQELRFFATAPRPCAYLDDRNAISVFADPGATLTPAIYDQLARFGFRRSGNDLYVPACPSCSECIPVRIPVRQFEHSTNQKKVRSRNRSLVCTVSAAEYKEEHFRLYADYLAARHPGGGMDQTDPEEYRRFLCSDWCDTLFLEIRRQRKLVAVAVTDRLHNALSAVYTFFDPQLDRLSLGTYAVLRQIELARDMECDWLYLGYWIPGSKKMMYKRRFQPMPAFHHGRWPLLQNGKLPESGSSGT